MVTAAAQRVAERLYCELCMMAEEHTSAAALKYFLRRCEACGVQAGVHGYVHPHPRGTLCVAFKETPWEQDI